MRFSTLFVPFAFSAQLAAATSVAYPAVPSLRGVSEDTVRELLNTTDFSVIDATKWATLLEQPHEVLAAWDPTTKHRMFSLLKQVLDFGTGLEKRDLTPAQAKIKINTDKAVYDTTITTDEATDKEEKSCLKSTTCLLCVGAAGSVAIGKIAGCAGTALGAEALTAPETAGLSTVAVVTAFIECCSIPTAGFLTATVACIQASKAIEN